MILAFLGDEVSKQALAQGFDAIPGWGTRPDNVEQELQARGYFVRWFADGTLEKLQQLLANQFPVTLFFYAADLPRGRRGLHCAVLIEMTQRSVTLLDPSLRHEFKLNKQEFIGIWANLDN
jgi:hypothetical protein